MKTSIKNSRGSTQSTMVLTVAAVTLVILAGVIVSVVRTQISTRSENKLLTQEMAEFGMQEALKKIQENPAWSEGFQNIKYRTGYYTVSIQKVNDSTFQAVSLGFINDVRTSLTCTYRLEADSTGVKPKPLSWETN